jgi:excisionase family DNA binding protein
MKDLYAELLVEPTIGPEEVAKILGISRLTAHRWAQQGRLPSFALPFGSRGKCQYRFRVSELEKYLQQHAHSANEFAVGSPVEGG